MQQLLFRCAELHVNHIATCGDPFEFGSARPLDFGHWSAHKLEQLSEYRIRHGEAVAIGMIQASRLAERLGRIDSRTTDRQIRLLEQLGLPVAAPTEHHTDEVLARMRLDKKTTGGQLRFVLPSRMGHVELVDAVPEELVRELI